MDHNMRFDLAKAVMRERIDFAHEARRPTEDDAMAAGSAERTARSTLAIATIWGWAARLFRRAVPGGVVVVAVLAAAGCTTSGRALAPSIVAPTEGFAAHVAFILEEHGYAVDHEALKQRQAFILEEHGYDAANP